MKVRKWHHNLAVIVLTGLLITSGNWVNPGQALANASYGTALSAANSTAGASTALTFSTTVSANSTVIKSAVLHIPEEYSLAAAVPSQIGTLDLSVPSLGAAESWPVNNGETITVFQGNTNTYTYTVTFDKAAKTLTVLAGTGQRTEFPDDLRMTFTLNSGILTNAPLAGTFSWPVEATDYYNNQLLLRLSFRLLTGLP